MPQIEVVLDLDANGNFHVRAKDLGSGNMATSTVDRSAAGLVNSSNWATLRRHVPVPVLDRSERTDWQ
ncbi:hypothetical protein GCM10009863_48050 [Streptomyces axinellae]|uniref:Uncharacterized protein n=1 Tax=Streptomyces axinellae TaxID=552788 RepID=A0ABN3QIQ2_9ACTN